MQFRTLIPAMAFLCGWGGSVLLPSVLILAAQDLFLGDRHKNLGVECSGCHREDPPKQRVPMAVCLGCHGDYSKVVAKTSKINPNPHDSHLGEIECEKCHHSHKPSVNACNACPLMEMKVP
jgi:Cytochrome c3